MTKITATITYLEMLEPSARRAPVPLAPSLALMKAETIPLHYYRYLYGTIGRDHYWIDRLTLDDEALSALLHKDTIEISILYAAGVPAGFFELDTSDKDNIEVVYLGIMPDFTGRGFGPYLLTNALDAAWNHDPHRVHIQTNTLDHPAALPMYQKFGFKPFLRQTRTFEPPKIAAS